MADTDHKLMLKLGVNYWNCFMQIFLATILFLLLIKTVQPHKMASEIRAGFFVAGHQKMTTKLGLDYY